MESTQDTGARRRPSPRALGRDGGLDVDHRAHAPDGESRGPAGAFCLSLITAEFRRRLRNSIEANIVVLGTVCHAEGGL